MFKGSHVLELTYALPSPVPDAPHAKFANSSKKKDVEAIGAVLRKKFDQRASLRVKWKS